jgi:hypothetical protein
VSLLSPETLHLFFGATHVLALRRDGWRRRLGQTRAYPVAALTGESWQDALVAFSAALGDLKCRRVRVVLSHQFVQYRVLPWRDDLVGDAEYEALARLEFSAAFGTLADAWTIGLSDEPPGVSRVASALPSALLAGFGTAASEAGVTLLALQPYLAVVAKLWDRVLVGNDCRWLLLYEPGRICVVARQAGSWCWVRHLRAGDDWAEQLPSILRSEAQLAGLDTSPANVHVFAPGAKPDALLALRSTGFQMLEPVSELGFHASRDGAFAPAWLG